MLSSELLINAYDRFGGFCAKRYFTIRYGGIPSSAEAEFPSSPQKTSYRKVLDTLQLDPDDYDIVYQEWKVGKYAEDEREDDYIKFILLASTSANVCVEIQTYSKAVSVEFLFDATADKLSAWVSERIGRLRTALAKPKKPMFRVLSLDDGGFRTQVVDIEPTDADLAVNYNDSIQEVDRIIQRSIEEKNSGLILLHGIPGTGKTTYIKTLVTRNKKEKFIFIPNDFVDEMLKPSFITFLITQKDSILVIEDAESVILSREQTQNKSVVSTVLQITDGLFSDYLNIKVICTFNTDVSKIDKALFRKGRMIAFYEFGELTDDKALALTGLPSVTDLPAAKTLAELYNRQDRSFDETGRKQKIGFGA